MEGEERREEKISNAVPSPCIQLACYMLIIDQSLQGVVTSFHYETKRIGLKALIDGIETEGMFR